MGTNEQKGKEGEGKPPREDGSKWQAKAKDEVTEQQIAFAKVLAFYYWGNFWGK